MALTSIEEESRGDEKGQERAKRRSSRRGLNDANKHKKGGFLALTSIKKGASWRAREG